MQRFFDGQIFGQQLRSCRGKKSLRTLAQELGISAATLSRTERGQEPTLNVFLTLCFYFNLNPMVFTRSVVFEQDILPFEEVEPALNITVSEDYPSETHFADALLF